jgi:hypothetical protein
MQTFANVTHELPKFSEEEGDGKKWWTKRAGFSINPDKTNSAKEFTMRKIKCMSGSVEPMIIADHTDEVPPKDPFKVVHVPKPPKSTGKEPCTAKPTDVVHLKPTDEADFAPVSDMVEREQQQE